MARLAAASSVVARTARPRGAVRPMSVVSAPRVTSLAANAIGREDAAAIDRPALDQRERDAPAGVAERRYAAAQQNRMDVQPDFIHETLRQERLRQLAAAHQADVLARLLFEIPHERRGVAAHEFGPRIV